jgi:signal transduction histidine kinase
MAIQVSFEMLSQSIIPSEDQKKRMAYISNGIGQLSRLIEDLVDWASIEQGKFRLEMSFFSPATLVEEGLVGPQGRAAARGLSLKSQAVAGLPMVFGDKRRILQVLNNLLENAIRHTAKGGSVEVSLSRAADPADGVQFAIRDTGEGIAPENLSMIFESFNQAKSQAGGGRLGLGLSIAKEIIGSHKGRIWVESPGLDKGSTFYFTIPVPKPGE